jgi:ABC-type nitrate/sulfonate/bicarbonate transport system substrate-binding protein
MKSKASFKTLLVALLTTIVVAATAQAAAKRHPLETIDYIPFKPLTEALKGVKLKPVKDGPIRLPLITWPGDVATIDADSEGLFKKEGLNVELFVENDFAKQVKGVLEGETPISALHRWYVQRRGRGLQAGQHQPLPNLPTDLEQWRRRAGCAPRHKQPGRLER